MFKKMMVPIDMAHLDRLNRARQCAADLAKLYDVPVCYVGVTSTTPGKVAHTPQEFEQKLKAFAESEASAHGVETSCHMEISHDPTADVDDALMRAVKTTEADVVVMASHVPGAFDYIWPSNGGKLADHAACSIMLVRPE